MKIVLFVGFLIVGISKGNLEQGMDKSYRFTGRKLLTDWCALKCVTSEETYSNIVCDMGGTCNAQAPCIFGDVDKDKILADHNKLREKFAAGKEPNAEGLTVANMVALSWDEDLAFTASCNVAKCAGMHHEPCRATPKFPDNTGQNLYMSFGGDCVAIAREGGVQIWYDEVKLIDKSRILSDAHSYAYDPSTAHFTQMMWAKTTHVGCALSVKKEDGQDTCVLACNYGPPGNVETRGMFVEGKPCSQCPNNLTSSKMYKSLCGDGGRNQSIAAFLYGALLLSLACSGQ